jgi:hypothetical protein
MYNFHSVRFIILKETSKMSKLTDIYLLNPSCCLHVCIVRLARPDRS